MLTDYIVFSYPLVVILLLIASSIPGAVTREDRFIIGLLVWLAPISAPILLMALTGYALLKINQIIVDVIVRD